MVSYPPFPRGVLRRVRAWRGFTESMVGDDCAEAAERALEEYRRCLEGGAEEECVERALQEWALALDELGLTPDECRPPEVLLREAEKHGIDWREAARL